MRQTTKTLTDGTKVRYAIENISGSEIAGRNNRNWKQFVGQKIFISNDLLHLNDDKFETGSYTTQADSGKFYLTLTYKGFEFKTEKALIEFILKEKGL